MACAVLGEMQQAAAPGGASAGRRSALPRQLLGLLAGILVCVVVHAYSGCGHDHGAEPKPSYLPEEKRLGGWIW